MEFFLASAERLPTGLWKMSSDEGHLYYHYGIRHPKTMLNRVFGVPNSIIVQQIDPLGDLGTRICRCIYMVRVGR